MQQSGFCESWLASAGAELNLDAAITTMCGRMRLGVAAPIANREFGRARSVSVYFTFGSSF